MLEGQHHYKGTLTYRNGNDTNLCKRGVELEAECSSRLLQDEDTKATYFRLTLSLTVQYQSHKIKCDVSQQLLHARPTKQAALCFSCANHATCLVHISFLNLAF